MPDTVITMQALGCEPGGCADCGNPDAGGKDAHEHCPDCGDGPFCPECLAWHKQADCEQAAKAAGAEQ